MQDSKGINSLKQARELLEKHSIKGEHLAYINKDEAKLLKYMGGAGIPVNSSGIPSYFIKKAFKAVTKPIAKVLDKIVPNEIKPALPYLAAFAPMLAGYGYLGTGLSGLTTAQDPENGYLGEDIAFCRLWTNIGGKIYADTQTPLTHFGSHAFHGSLSMMFDKQKPIDDTSKK